MKVDAGAVQAIVDIARRRNTLRFLPTPIGLPALVEIPTVTGEARSYPSRKTPSVSFGTDGVSARWACCHQPNLRKHKLRIDVEMGYRSSSLSLDQVTLP